MCVWVDETLLGWDAVPLRGYGLSCGSISMGVMKQTKHLVLDRNWPVYP